MPAVYICQTWYRLIVDAMHAEDASRAALSIGTDSRFTIASSVKRDTAKAVQSCDIRPNTTTLLWHPE